MERHIIRFGCYMCAVLSKRNSQQEKQKIRCSPLIVGVFISFFFVFYRQCDNSKMIEEPKKNEGANGRIMIRHVTIQIVTFME